MTIITRACSASQLPALRCNKAITKRIFLLANRRLTFFGTHAGVYSVLTIDYRCDNRRYWLSSAHKLSSSNLNFLKPRTTTANSDFWSWLTHQLLGRLKSTIPNLQIYALKKGKFWEVGVEDWQSTQDSFFFEFADAQVLGEGWWTRHFCIPGVFSYAMIPRCGPDSRGFFFHRHIYSLWFLLARLRFSSYIIAFADK
jgi:hypothetical protein